MKRPALFVLILAPFLMAQSCAQQDIPTTEQIELYLPESFRDCPHAPPSPGRKATKKQRAQYIIRLYNAWKQCYDDNKSIDRLYLQYRDRLEAITKGDD